MRCLFILNHCQQTNPFLMEALAAITEITNKDIQRLTGKHQRSASRILKKIKKKLGKGDDQYVTVLDYCNFFGLSVIMVMTFLTESKKAKQ
jgi:3-oxoacyl-[acyl-carrier-protein] synthase III